MTPFERYEELLRNAEPTARKHLPDATARISELSAKLKDGRIRVMVFGAYNAGKSTLINALLGEERAQVGDIPTTHSVATYCWQGHVLLDTPGINAPIADTKISEAQLKHTDLVLFMLRQEDQDAADILERIFHLLEEKRPLFILLNYEDSAPELKAEIQLHLNRTLVKHAQRRRFALNELGHVPVLLINARSALKARLESKARLQEHSGYDDFIQRFHEWLRRHDDETKRLEQTLGVVERVLLEPVQEALDKKSVGGQDSDELSRQIAHLQRERRLLRDGASNRVRFEVSSRRPELATILDRAVDSQVVISEVEKIASTISERVHAWFEKQIQEKWGRTFNAELSQDEVSVGSITKSQGDGWLGSNKKAILEGAKRVATKENLVEALKAGRRLKLPGLKGRWSKTLDKWAGRAAPVIQVTLGLLEIGIAHHDEQNANQAAIDQMLRRDQWIEDICAQIRTSLLESIEEALSDVVGILVEPLTTQLEAIRTTASEVEKDRMHWHELRASFRAVIF